MDVKHNGYLDREEVKILLCTLLKASNISKDETDEILEYTIDQLVDKDNQMDWYTFWEWISYNEYEKLKCENNDSTTTTTPTTPQCESDCEDNNVRPILKEMNKLSIEEKRIHTMCTLLDIDGIRLFLNDWLIPMPDNMKKDELVWFCVDSVMYCYFNILLLYRKQRKNLSIENENLRFLSVEQLRRMIADIGFPYLYSNSCDELAEVLQYVYFI